MTRKAKGVVPPPPAAAPVQPGAIAQTAAPAALERQPDFIWGGQPVYECRFCRDRYQRIGDLASVVDHERTQHPTNLRVSEVLGPDGRPLIVRAD
jgi:hypothetical protein